MPSLSTKHYTLNTAFIDTHAHLTFPDYDRDRNEVIARAWAAGLEYIINIGSGLDINDSARALELAKTGDKIYCTAGFHPHHAASVMEKGEEAFTAMAKIAADPKVVAIGEVGLDYHYDGGGHKTQQLDCFKRLIGLAHGENLPLIIHDRDAHEDTLFTLERERASTLGGVMHCFSGDVGLLRRVLNLGFYISVTGAVTFKKKVEQLHEVIKFVPIERLLIETDCPFIAPEPYRGKRNEPAYVVEVARKVAELKKLSLEDVARITTLNAKRLFHLPGEVREAKVAYPIRHSLYLNITNRCTLACTFCPKRSGSFEVKGHNLKLASEPDIEDIFRGIGDPSSYKEVVFCGFGEPTMRLELMKAIASRLKEFKIKVRLDTDGLANLIYERNILPELKCLVDEISVSLNAPDPVSYAGLCPSKYGEKAFMSVCEFVREAKKYIPTVIATAVDCPGVDIEACRKLAENELGITFRARTYQDVG